MHKRHCQRQVDVWVTLGENRRFPIKYRKEPHYKVLEAHALADFINDKINLIVALGADLPRTLPKPCHTGFIGIEWVIKDLIKSEVW